MSVKRFDLDHDVFNNHYFQYEAVEYYWTFFSGAANEANIKFPNHYLESGISGSYFIEFYDRPKNDISSVKVMTLTYGYSSSSLYYSGNFTPGHAQHKLKMYRLMAKHLLGDENKKFQIDGKELNEAVFYCLPRNQYKDQIIPKGSAISFYFTGTPGAEVYDGNDALRDENSKLNLEFGGEYTYLFDQRTQKNRGITFTKAGIYVIDPETFGTGSNGARWSGSFGYEVLAKGISGSTYNDLLWGLKNKIHTIKFTGSSKVESAFYKCTAGQDEFNYSSNPSYVTSQQEIKCMISGSRPTTFITQVGLLSRDNELLAVGKIYKPIKKDPTIGATIYVRVDQ